MSETDNPIAELLERQPVVVLDGGFATELEARGVVLDEALWSAALLIDAPDAIERLHLDYLEAGADCIVSASYQATLEGFARRGLQAAEAEAALLRSVDLALSARETFWSRGSRGDRRRPLVAAGIGPYGAYLADGSEFTGDYGLSEGELYAFHRRRWRLLAGSGADLLACETVPSIAEARALARLLDETPGIGAWLSFSCRDGERLSDGTELAAAVRELEPVAGILAIGVNCTAPRHISSLLGRAGAETGKPLVAYPNSGETWDAAGRRWIGAHDRCDLAASAPEWLELGARLIGGCCRTTPADIRRLRTKLISGTGTDLPNNRACP